jgi:hypothetical protein
VKDPSWRSTRKENLVVAIDNGTSVLLPGAGKTVRLPGHEITFVHSRPDGAYSLVEWVSAPGVPGTPLHIHRVTDEAF